MPASKPFMPFGAPPAAVRCAVEAERLAMAHRSNPAFAVESSRIDPLPHQRIAVYDHMLKQDPLRFLLADDAGAGKTIMAGLYIREMLTRNRIRRVLIAPPAGLVGNWVSELSRLFQLEAAVVDGAAIRGASNPFAEADLAVCSIDTLRTDRAMKALGEAPAYDLVVFDEAHKLSCGQRMDGRVEPSARWKAAAAVAGVPLKTGRRFPWRARHLLLMTATPHQGKDYPYFAIWRLLEPEALAAEKAFREAPPEFLAARFIRRTKEEMVDMEGRPLYPPRTSSTLGYGLSEAEHALYEAATDYFATLYNKALVLSKGAAQLALGVFQRRLASSAYALLRSLERRAEKLRSVIADLEEKRLDEAKLEKVMLELAEKASLACGEAADDADGEIDESSGEELLAGSLEDLREELECVEDLAGQARGVLAAGDESKFVRLREALKSPAMKGQKVLIFTEHKDTLAHLAGRFEALGLAGRIAMIHGGMGWPERQEQIEFFRKPDGAQIMLCTDAAAEGVNLQFAWICINYDIPWNPARLEQRMGRVHRYGQKRNVLLFNMVASDTREGRVLETLLEKLEKIRQSLNSDKVFDCIGRCFSNVSIAEFMREAMAAGSDRAALDAVAARLDGALTEDQVKALQEQEEKIYGRGGDVKAELPRLKENLESEWLRRLLPGYVRGWLKEAAPLLGLRVEGDLDGEFRLRSMPGFSAGHETLWDAVRAQSGRDDDPPLSLSRTDSGAVWVHPGEPVFGALLAVARERLRPAALAGAVLLDAEASSPYVLEAARLRAVRRGKAGDEVLEERMACVRHGGTAAELCPAESFLVLGDAARAEGAAVALIGRRAAIRAECGAVLEQAATDMAGRIKAEELEALPELRRMKAQGLEYAASSDAARLADLLKEIRDGGGEEVRKEYERLLASYREKQKDAKTLLDMLDESAEAVAPDEPEVLGIACVMPGLDPGDTADGDRPLCVRTEEIAMRAAIAWEQARGASAVPVHTPDRARAAGLQDYPGFDVLSVKDGVRRCIEVKGSAGTGRIAMSQNEFARAANLGPEYWLYAVFGCGTESPRLFRVQDPFRNLLMRHYMDAGGRHEITMKEILEQGEE